MGRSTRGESKRPLTDTRVEFFAGERGRDISNTLLKVNPVVEITGVKTHRPMLLRDTE